MWQAVTYRTVKTVQCHHFMKQHSDNSAGYSPSAGMHPGLVLNHYHHYQNTTPHCSACSCFQRDRCRDSWSDRIIQTSTENPRWDNRSRFCGPAAFRRTWAAWSRFNCLSSEASWQCLHAAICHTWPLIGHVRQSQAYPYNLSLQETRNP